MFDRQSLRITALGQLGTGGGAGEDIFSFGLRASGTESFDAVTALAELDVAAIAGIFGTYFQASGTNLSMFAHLYSVKVAALSTAGEYLSSSVEAEPDPGGVGGFNGTLRYPNQVALAVSLGAGTTIGRAVRGRYYLPLPAHTLLSTGRITTANVLATLATSVTFLDALNTQLNLDITQICKLQIMSDIGSGTSNPVSVVRVGDVFDTIRSRRNALDESYAVGAVA